MKDTSPTLRFGPFTLDPLQGELFKGGRKVSLNAQPLKLLTLLVENAGRMVSREAIQEHLWPPGTHVEVDQGINAGIRQIRQALGDSATSPRYLETLPRKGYRFLAPVDRPTEVQALGAAAKVPSAGLAPPRWFRRWGAAGLVMVALGGLALLLSQAGRYTAALGASPRPVLVVLPFKDLGTTDPAREAAQGKPDGEILADSLTEELISHLGARYPERLAVIARTSVMRYKGTEKGIAEIARELDADYLLESSLRREGDRLRVTVQLIDGRDSSHLWAENYDRSPDSLLEFQREVAQRVAETLGRRLAPGLAIQQPAALETGRESPSAEGYLLYLKGLEALHRESYGGQREARERFQEALRRDPDFAPAYVGLAQTLGPPARDPVAALLAHRAALERALALDPELPEAYLALGQLKLYTEFDTSAARRALDRALELRPAYPEALHHRAAWFASQGDWEEARRDLARARRLDPLSAAVQSDAGFFAYFEGRWEEALEHSVRTLELEPGYLWARQCIALTLLQDPWTEDAWNERFGKPLAEWLGVEEGVPFEEVPRRFWAARWQYLERLLDRGGPALHGEMAVARKALGDDRGALEYLRQARRAHSGWMIPFLGVHPLFQDLPADFRQELAAGAAEE